MKKTIVTLLLSIATFSTPFGAQAIQWENGRLTTDYSVDIYYENVYGNVDRSVLDVDRSTKDRWHYTEGLKVHLEQKITDTANLEFFFYGRHTSDRQIQNERAKILQAYLRIYADNFEFAVGDVGEYYTKYTFNNTFLGVRGWAKPFDSLKIMLLSGRNREGADDTYEHIFGGARIEYSPSPNYIFGTTYIHTEITKLYPGSGTLDYSDDVVSLDTRIRLLNRKLLIYGETAFSWYTEDRRDPASDKPQGWAVNLELDYRPIPSLKLSLDYEYVQPEFVTIMGSAAKDRETVKGEVRYYPTDSLDIWAKYRFTGDRLSERSPLTYRTETNYSETGLTYKPFFAEKESYFRNLKFDLRLDYTRMASTDSPMSVDNGRFDTRLIVSNIYKKMRYSLEYGLRYTDDSVENSSDSLINTVGAKWGYSFRALGLDWDVDLSAKLDYVTTYEPDDVLHDTISSISSGMTVRYSPTNTLFRLSYLGVFSRIGGGYDTYKNATEVDLEQLLYSNETITSTLGISYRNLDFQSENHEDSYGENIYMLSLTLRF
jgi:hypothetical protein